MNCNYIKNKLIKRINETYFKDYQELEIAQFPVKTPDTDTVECLETLVEYLHDCEFKYEIEDLINGTNTSYVARIYQEDLEFAGYNILRELARTSKVTREVMNILTDLSKESYIVGGFLRDTLMGNKSKDIDFVTDAKISDVIYKFKAKGFNFKQVGEHFLVTMVEKDGEQFEIAAFRKDKDNSGGEIGTIREDAQRRDFTCNALYFNLSSSEIVDPNGTALDAIQNKELRFIGNARERIFEDFCRVFRFYRFIDKGLTPHPDSLRKVRQFFSIAVKETNPERIKNELERIVNLNRY